MTSISFTRYQNHAHLPRKSVEGVGGYQEEDWLVAHRVDHRVESSVTTSHSYSSEP